MMGARFTSNEQALGPMLKETAQRGLICVDGGSSPRSIAGQIAGANNLPFAKAELILDAVPTTHQPVHAIEILIPAERGQERLRAGIVVGIAARLVLSRPVIFLG